MKRAAVIYDSKFGNNEKLAQALKTGMTQSGLAVDVLRVGDFETRTLTEYDLICVGGPTHIARISNPVKDLLSGLESLDLRGKKGFCFGTRMDSRMNIFDINGSAKKIESRLKKKEVHMLTPAVNVLVAGREGPLVEGSEKRFIDLGAELGEMMRQ
jgi:flavorubredoxin